MPNTFRVSIAGGIDAVTDLALGDGKHVVYMENLDVRSGKAVPFNLPLVNPNVVVPVDSVQVFAYRTRILFSSARRDYAAEFMDDRERIYWTEYGGNPQKMIDGTVVSLGIVRPSLPPAVGVGMSISPANVVATVTTGGALQQNTPVSFRLAYQTAFGVLPPSGIIQPSIGVNGAKVTLTWDNPVLDVPATQILVFLGIAGGDEKLFATLGARVSSFSYESSSTASGELASSYDQASLYQYCTTYLRNVNGVEDESGPSSPTPPIVASSSRNVEISPWGEGVLNSPNAITWGSPYPAFRFVAGSTLPGVSGASGSSPLAVTSISLEPQTNRVLCVFGSSHYFYDGGRIIFVGLPGSFPVDLNGYTLPVEIQVEEGMLTSCYLVVGESFVLPSLPLAGVTAYSVGDVAISTLYYTPEAGVITIDTVSPHTFGAEKAIFSGFTDTGWNNQPVAVMGDPNRATRLFVQGKSLPSDTVFTSCTITRALTAVQCVSTPPAPAPIVGDVLYFDMVTYGVTGSTVKDAHKVLAAPQGAYLINAFIPGATGVTGPTYTEGIQFVPNNDYITHRRIYRAGGTANFQLCKELELDQLDFLDALPDMGLGQVLPTLFTQNDVGVVVEPAPFGLAGLTRHYGMGFAFDPSSNRLVWTLTGFMDAWPTEFYRDFDYRILALVSYNQALCVFCDDGVYRIEGTEPTNLQRHKTKADPCRAGGSLQFLGNRIIYLSDRGLVSFNGQESEPLTDLKVPGDFWLSNSLYLEGSAPGCYLVPWTQNAAYERLRGEDLPNTTPRYLMPYLVQHVNQLGIRSFVKYGKYFLYWGGDVPGYEAQTMICVDFASPGNPISVIGVKAIDAFVDERERVHMLLSAPESV